MPPLRHVMARGTWAVKRLHKAKRRKYRMDFETQEEVRTKYALIRRGLSALRNAIEGLALLHATGEPYFDDSDEGRQKLIMVVEKAAHHATQSEIDALIAEYGPDARHVLT
jgi:hypothetical protein